LHRHPKIQNHLVNYPLSQNLVRRSVCAQKSNKLPDLRHKSLYRTPELNKDKSKLLQTTNRCKSLCRASNVFFSGWQRF
jgi:hypothetical protein